MSIKKATKKTSDLVYRGEERTLQKAPYTGGTPKITPLDSASQWKNRSYTKKATPIKKKAAKKTATPRVSSAPKKSESPLTSAYKWREKR